MTVKEVGTLMEMQSLLVCIIFVTWKSDRLIVGISVAPGREMVYHYINYKAGGPLNRVWFFNLIVINRVNNLSPFPIFFQGLPSYLGYLLSLLFFQTYLVTICHQNMVHKPR